MGFLQEPLLGGLVAGQVRREELDGHLALQARVLGRVDDPHAAVAEFGADRVRAEGGTWREGHEARLDYSAWRAAESGHDGRAVACEEPACGIPISPVEGDRVSGVESGQKHQ